MNPKSIQAAMKKMGIQQQELLAKEVIIKQNDKIIELLTEIRDKK